jgi:hypothetical protein
MMLVLHKQPHTIPGYCSTGSHGDHSRGMPHSHLTQTMRALSRVLREQERRRKNLKEEEPYVELSTGSAFAPKPVIGIVSAIAVVVVRSA